jgi:peptidoglycan/xylan/chitin deacetylase (PgdA/CDA1 family)
MLAALLSPAGRRARLAVFTYHQVLERKDPLRPDEPDHEQFAQDLRILGRTFNIMPLTDAVRRLGEGTLPAGAAAITFDDGYANNYDIAAPMLAAAGLPAIFFIATGAVETGVMWNDLVIEAFARRSGALVTTALPREAACATGVPGATGVAQLLSVLKYRPLDERFATAERFYCDNVDGVLPRLMMTRSMVADLARRGFEIGGHSVQHPILKHMPDESARAEIEQCGRWIAQVAGRWPTTFAYPNGRPGVDFTPRHAAMVAAAGYEAAVTTRWAVARPGTDPYALPRVGAWWRRAGSLVAGMARVYSRSYLSSRSAS